MPYDENKIVTETVCPQVAEFTVLGSAERSQVEIELKSLQRKYPQEKSWRGGGQKSRSQSSWRGEAG